MTSYAFLFIEALQHALISADRTT